MIIDYFEDCLAPSALLRASLPATAKEVNLTSGRQALNIFMVFALACRRAGSTLCGFQLFSFLRLFSVLDYVMNNE